MPSRRLALAAVLAFAAALPAAAHHGVIFTSEEPTTITGPIVKPMTGNPHFEFQMQVDDVRWTVDVGDSYRLKKAGLARDGSDLSVGRTVTVEGFPATDAALNLIRARTIWLGDTPHRLYDEEEPRQY